jgi:predicted nucleic acid-binding protein
VRRIFVDANVFLRFFVGDDAAQQKQAAGLFEAAAAGAVGLLAGPPVLFEIAWTLRSAYDLPREKVLEVLSAIMGMQGLKLTDRVLVQAALQGASLHGQEFADAYIQASAEAQGASLATFNKRDFTKAAARLHGFA